MSYPRYFRKDGRCIRRSSDTNGTEVRTPENDKDILPLIMSTVAYPTKARFDDEIKNMEEVNLDMYEQYIYRFIRGVHQDIESEMTQRVIARQLANMPKQKVE